jgi:PEP-CTERM motif-containing protein
MEMVFVSIEAPHGAAKSSTGGPIMRNAQASGQASCEQYRGRSCRRAITAGGIAALAVAHLCPAAKADVTPVTLTDAEYSYTIEGPNYYVSKTTLTPPGQVSVPIGKFSSTGVATGSDKVIVKPDLVEIDGNLTIQAGLLGAVNGFMELVADTTYEVEVVANPDKTPPSSITKVPITEYAVGGLIASAGNEVTIINAYGSIDVSGPAGGPSLYTEDWPDGPTSIDETPTAFFPIGEAVSVGKIVDATISTTAYGLFRTQFGGFDASVDPAFEIDPSFPYASDFELEYSPGFSSGAAPEPSTWLLLASGFGSLAVCRAFCRRRQMTAPATTPSS